MLVQTVVAILMTGNPAHVGGRSMPRQEARVSPCELHANSKRYFGKNISVRGNFFHGVYQSDVIVSETKCRDRLSRSGILIEFKSGVSGPARFHFEQMRSNPFGDIDCIGVQMSGVYRRVSDSDLAGEYVGVLEVSYIEDVFMCDGFDRYYAPPISRASQGR